MSMTKEQIKEAKRLFRLPPVNFNMIDLSKTTHPEFITRAYMNNRYVVMISDNQKIGNVIAIRAMIQRHDDKPIPNHWREIQSIKNEIFGLEEIAVEFYPRQRHVIDDANIYWIWIFPKGVLPEYME